MLDWLVRRILRSKAVDEKLNEVTLKVQLSMKENIIALLEDEEIAEGITEYGDALYERYTKKFWGSVGGKQQGINKAMDELNPLANILDEEGNPNLAGIIKGFLSGGINLGLSGTENTKSLKRKDYKYRY